MRSKVIVQRSATAASGSNFTWSWIFVFIFALTRANKLITWTLLNLRKVKLMHSLIENKSGQKQQYNKRLFACPKLNKGINKKRTKK